MYGNLGRYTPLGTPVHVNMIDVRTESRRIFKVGGGVDRVIRHMTTDQG